MGVVFRRGPAEWVELIRWDTRKDQFEAGQWFHGRIDADKSDLSPSGRLLVYFVASRRRRVEASYKGTWTAVSHPPYLAALALWPEGSTWFGGGLFLDEGTVRLNHLTCSTQHPNHPPQGLRVVYEPLYFWARSVWADRYERDGWRVQKRIKVPGLAGSYPEEWEKADPQGSRTLAALNLSTGRLEREPFLYQVQSHRTGKELAWFDAEWADWDQQGRLVMARAGKLWCVEIRPRGRGVAYHEIADFNNHRPDPQPAPERAKRW